MKAHVFKSSSSRSLLFPPAASGCSEGPVSAGSVEASLEGAADLLFLASAVLSVPAIAAGNNDATSSLTLLAISVARLPCKIGDGI